MVKAFAVPGTSVSQVSEPLGKSRATVCRRSAACGIEVPGRRRSSQGPGTSTSASGAELRQTMPTPAASRPATAPPARGPTTGTQA